MISRIKDRTRSRFHLNLSEVGAQDIWQRLVLGFALVASERTVAEQSLARVVGFIERMGLASVTADEREVIAYGDAAAAPLDERGALAAAEAHLGVRGSDDGWVPEAWRATMDAGRDGGEGDR